MKKLLLVVSIVILCLTASYVLYQAYVVTKESSKVIYNLTEDIRKYTPIRFTNLKFRYVKDGYSPVTYYIPDIKIINLSPEVLVMIKNHNIVMWNDISISTINPGVNLPDAEIVVIEYVIMEKFDDYFKRIYILSTKDDAKEFTEYRGLKDQSKKLESAE